MNSWHSEFELRVPKHAEFRILVLLYRIRTGRCRSSRSRNPPSCIRKTLQRSTVAAGCAETQDASGTVCPCCRAACRPGKHSLVRCRQVSQCSDPCSPPQAAALDLCTTGAKTATTTPHMTQGV